MRVFPQPAKRVIRFIASIGMTEGMPCYQTFEEGGESCFRQLRMLRLIESPVLE
jgi:hypothetical protein